MACSPDRQLALLKFSIEASCFVETASRAMLVARTHARTLAYSHPSDTDSQSFLSSLYSFPPPSFPSCYPLYAYSQLPTLASHSEEIIV